MGGTAVLVREWKTSVTPTRLYRILKFRSFVEIFGELRKKLRRPYEVYLVLIHNRSMLPIFAFRRFFFFGTQKKNACGLRRFRRVAQSDISV